MEIILNETQWAREQLESRTIGKDTYNTFRRIARYYIDKGYDTDSVHDKLSRFLSVCKPDASPVKWDALIENAIKHAEAQPAIDAGSIHITKNEADVVRGLKGKQLQRLAFTLLCLAKYWNLYSAKNDSWVRTPDNDIMRYANIKTSVKRQSAMYHDLMECGLIRFAKKVDNTNVRVNFLDDSPAEIEIDDFRNLGNQYLMYVGEPYFKCECCGVVTKRNNPDKGRKQKYCNTCAVKIKTQQSVNSAMRKRGADTP